MSSYYVLMLGKGSYNPTPQVLSYKSNCYFDWFGFSYPSAGIKEMSNSQAIFGIKDNDVYGEIMNQRKKSYAQNDYRLLQNIVLVTDESNDLLSKLKTNSEGSHALIFVSFVYANISSDRERRISAQNIKEIFRFTDDGQKLLDDVEENISVYSTFDHCEYIVVCDGSKVQLKHYLSFLKKLRAEKDICDILSLYGYNNGSAGYYNEKAVALIKYEDGLAMGGEDDGNNYTALGRFDHFKVIDEIDIWKLFDKLGNLNQNPNRCSKAFIGVKDSGCLLEDFGCLNFNSDDRYKKLIKKIQVAYDDCISAYSDSLDKDEETDSCLIGGLVEIKNMMISTLGRGISKYYVLCVVDSYVALLRFIKEKIILASTEDFERNYGAGRIDLRKQEILINLMNSYFNYIQLLSSSMLHNDRKFVSADPYQLSCFDMPPRLIAFYTAISYYMIKLLNTQSSDNYTVMLVPDFKHDIYVDSLTCNRDYEDERNIIIIHINEKSSYDILGTMKVIAHEIAHHVGQSTKHRQERAKCYVKCCIAMMITEAYKNVSEKDVWSITMGESPDKNFAMLVDMIYESFNFEKEFMLDDIREKDSWYYTDSVIRKFVNFWSHENDRDGAKAQQLRATFKEFLKQNSHFSVVGYREYIPEDEEIRYIIEGTIQTRNEEFTREFVSNILVQIFYKNFYRSEIGSVKQQENHISYPFFDSMMFLFRECMADVQMLSLLASISILRKYGKDKLPMQEKERENNAILQIRKSTVLNTFSDEIQEKTIEFDKSPAKRCSQKYICQNAVRYFNLVRTEKNIKHVVTALEDAATMEKVILEIDNVINHYLDDLVL